LLVVALDPPFGRNNDKRALNVALETSDFSAGYKVGLPLILEEGVFVVREIKESTGKPVIVDFKLADIGEVMLYTTRKLLEYGADAIIAHGFIGVNGALDALISESKRRGFHLILVTSMTHKDSERFIDKHFEELLRVAIDHEVHGVVVPATKPRLINIARRILGSKFKIYSPGIGVQGAEPGSAICAGADYEIVGRLITRSESPRKAAEYVSRTQRERWVECHGLQ